MAVDADWLEGGSGETARPTVLKKLYLFLFSSLVCGNFPVMN
jgi:hypothetical protein